MANFTQYAMGSADGAQFCQLWSARVDALERHLSAKRWALAAATIVLVAYPMARIAIPAAVHAFVPDVVRLVLKLI